MKKLRILIAERDMLSAFVISKIFQEEGYEVINTVIPGEDAIEKIEKFFPDLIILNIILDGVKDGIDIALEIQSRFGTPVMFLTDIIDKHSIRKIMNVKKFKLIVKPYSRKELLEAIDEITIHRCDN